MSQDKSIRSVFVDHLAKPGRVGPSRWKRAGMRLALCGTTLLILLAVLEIGTRMFTNTTPPLTVRDPAVGQTFMQSFEDKVYVREADREIVLRFNRVGFRGPDVPFEKPPGVCRVAILGDSMIASVAVDEEDTFACRLEGLLDRSNPQVRWEVLNFGVPGASPGQEVILYRKLVSKFDPDIVLGTFFVGNDLADNCDRLSHNPRIYFDLDDQGELYQKPFSAERATASKYLNRYSRFYVWQKRASRVALGRLRQAGGQLVPGNWIYLREPTEDVDHAWQITEKLASAFADEVRQDGARFALVMIPAAAQVYEDRFEELTSLAGAGAGQFDPDHPDERLGRLCREQGIPFFSMLDDFRKAAPDASSENEQQWLFHHGRGHFNERGNLLAAEAVHGFLTLSDLEQVARRPLVEFIR